MMTDYIILIPLLILVFGLTPIVVRDPYLNKQQKRIMTGIIDLTVPLVVSIVIGYLLFLRKKKNDK